MLLLLKGFQSLSNTPLPPARPQFPRDAADRISARSFLRYLRGRIQLSRLRRRLSAFDSVGDGFLREHDLENYVFESIPEMPDLAELQVCGCLLCVRKMCE